MITQKYLKSILNYNKYTGEFTWIVDFCKKIQQGTLAGSINGNGYAQIGINRKIYRVHRLAFLYMTGSFPTDEIDHINNIRSDNRWKNIRSCDASQNRKNTKPQKNRSSKYKGVYWNKSRKKWCGQIMVCKKHIHIGYFDCEILAAKEYDKAASKHFGEFAYLNNIK